MQQFFRLDGKYYDISVASLKREAAILDGENAGRTLSGDMDRDIIGTYYNYSMELDSSNCNAEDYDAFYEEITAPVDSHEVEFPYGQRVLVFKAYVSNASDNLQRITSRGNLWNGLSIKFTAMSPKRRPV